MDRHTVALALKRLIYPNGEKYHFYSKDLVFTTGTRPVKRKYINSTADVVRNDVLQINYFEQHFKPQDVLWDIGSHHGHYSIFAASIAKGNNQIFSFEPDSTARATQLKNIQLNHFQEKITVADIAVSDHDGTLHFESLNGNANSHIVKNEGQAGINIVTVNTKTLNTLLKELPFPTFIKIDTEGAEIDILRAGDQLLANSKVRFICELHPFAWDSFKVNYNDFIQILKKHNRSVQLLDGNKKLSDLPYYGTVLF